MATRTRKPVQSKSDRMRTLFKEGKSVAEVAKITDSNYAFVYGVAKRAGVQGTAANRRPVRAISTDPTGLIVTIRMDDGSRIEVNRTTGKTRKIR